MKVRVLLSLMIIVCLGVLSAVPCSANSKSVTVRVSCTILPIMEISMQRASAAPANLNQLPERPLLTMASMGDSHQVDVRSNLGSRFTTTQSTLVRPDGPVRLYSVTAL